MSDFREMVIEMTKLQVANAKALATNHKFQEGMSENPIYPVDRYDSDAEFLTDLLIGKNNKPKT